MLPFGLEKAKGYPGFQGDGRKEALKRLAYIESLAADYEVDISGWDLEQFYWVGDGSGELVIAPRKEALRIFKELYDTIKPTRRPRAYLDEVHAKLIQEIKNQRHYRSDETIRMAIEQCASNAQNFYHNYQAQMKELARWQRILSGRIPPPKELDKAIEALLEEGFYRWHGFRKNSNSFEFLTPEIHLTLSNKKANLDLQVPMGVFRLAITWPNLEVGVFAYADNPIDANGTLHPYIKQGFHGVCWGEAKPEYERLLLGNDFYGLANLVKQILLSNGQAGKPYCGLNTFYDIYKKKHDEKMKEALKAEGKEPLLSAEEKEAQREALLDIEGVREALLNIERVRAWMRYLPTLGLEGRITDNTQREVFYSYYGDYHYAHAHRLLRQLVIDHGELPAQYEPQLPPEAPPLAATAVLAAANAAERSIAANVEASQQRLGRIPTVEWERASVPGDGPYVVSVNLGAGGSGGSGRHPF